MNDHLCQSTSSWLQNNSDVTPSSRSEAIVRARGLDLIFVAAVCVVVGVPVLSLVVTCIVKHCRLGTTCFGIVCLLKFYRSESDKVVLMTLF